MRHLDIPEMEEGSLHSLSAHKGHALLLRVLAAANPDVDDPERRITLVVVGADDQLLSLRHAAIELGVAPDVVWSGGIWQANLVQKHRQDAQAFVALREAEGLPVWVLEAVRTELSLVLSDIDADRDPSRHAAARCVPGNDAETVATVLRGVWEGPRTHQEPAERDAAAAEWSFLQCEVVSCAAEWEAS